MSTLASPRTARRALVLAGLALLAIVLLRVVPSHDARRAAVCARPSAATMPDDVLAGTHAPSLERERSEHGGREPIPARSGTAAGVGLAKLEGLVLDPSGQPIPSARVRLLDGEPAAAGSPRGIQASACADARGRFLLPLCAPERREAVWLAADAPGFAPRVSCVETAGLARISLRPAARVHGRVRDADGAPVAGALVSCDAPGTDGESSRRVTTDELGEFVLEALAQGEVRELEVLARDGRRACSALSVSAALGQVEVQLPAGSERAVRLCEEASGRTLAGERVLLHGAIELCADADGRVSWRRSPEEPGAVELVLAERGTLTLSAKDLGTLAEPTVVSLPSKASVVRGTVRTPEGALEGARVRVAVLTTPSAQPGSREARFLSEQEVRTDALGAFALPVLVSPSSSVRLEAAHVGHGTASFTDVPGALCDTSLDIVLERCASIAGQVRGEPLPQAILWEGDGTRDRAAVRDDGTFRLDGLQPGRGRLLAAWDAQSDAGEQLTRVELAPGEERVLELVLDRPRASISGTLVEADGAPVSGCLVQAWGHNGWRDDGSFAARTDELGRFSLSVPADPKLVFDLEARENERLAARSDVPGGTSGLTLRFAAPGRLQLLVRDADTLAPISGVGLAWRAEPSQTFRALHGDERLRFGGADGRVDEWLPGTGGELLVTADGYPSASVTLALEPAASAGGAPDVWRPTDVLLRRGSTLRLSFVLGDPASPERMPLSVLAGGVRLVPENGRAEDARRVRASRAGEAVLVGLAPGTYRLESSLPCWTFDPPRITVREEPCEAFVAVLTAPDPAQGVR